MTAVKMHDNEVNTDSSLVSRLLAAQFPQWAGGGQQCPPATRPAKLNALEKKNVIGLATTDCAKKPIVPG
jgi:hypothetical protein